MIKEPTVLILGAGASNPYGYPLGWDLKRRVIDNTIVNTLNTNFYLSLGIMPAQLEKFHESLRKSPLTSIDAFLEHNPEFITAGKIAITRELILSEDENLIVSPSSSEDWYSYIFNKMEAPDFKNFGDNLSIITFNYDRSLEQFLYTSLLHSHTTYSENKIIETISKIPLLHLHGKIGNLPWEKNPGFKRPYERTTDKNLILESSRLIQIIHDNDISTEQFAKAKELIKKAVRIYFLGFGFHELNIRRLSINEIDTTGKLVRGTAYGIGSIDRQEIGELTNNTVQLYSYTCLGFLNDIAPLR